MYREYCLVHPHGYAACAVFKAEEWPVREELRDGMKLQVFLSALVAQLVIDEKNFSFLQFADPTNTFIPGNSTFFFSRFPTRTSLPSWLP